MRWVALILATGGGSGYAPVAPGTFGSLVAVGLFAAWWAADASLALYAGVTVVLGVAGVWACGAAEQLFDRKDDRRIVIDEVVGQLLALAPIALGLVGPSLSGAVVTAFVLFRVLDITKPGPIGATERRVGGGAGVMADDVVAGLLAALIWVVLGSLLAVSGAQGA